MKFRFICLAILLIGSITLYNTNNLNAAPPNPYEPAQNGVPVSLAGYRVLAVLNEEIFACLNPGEKRLVLQSADSSVEQLLSSVNNRAIIQALRDNNINDIEYWNWSFVSAEVSREDTVRLLKKANAQEKKFGCTQLGGPIQTSRNPASPAVPNGGELSNQPAGYPSWAVIQDDNLAVINDANAVSVILTAPTIGLSQTAYSAFLLNGRTNGSQQALLQVGFVFNQNGSGSVKWAVGFSKPVGQFFAPSYPYTVGHNYRFTISADNTDGWWLCAEDFSVTNSYRCQYRSSALGATGNRVVNSINTSVWVENWNTNTDWKSGFSKKFYAWGAKNYRNGIGQDWYTQDLWTAHHQCPTSWPPANAIVGTLVTGQTAYFRKAGIPVRCP